MTATAGVLEFPDPVAQSAHTSNSTLEVLGSSSWLFAPILAGQSAASRKSSQPGPAAEDQTSACLHAWAPTSRKKRTNQVLTGGEKC